MAGPTSKRLSTFSITDSLMALDSLPGGLSPTTLADDIFNDPLSWSGTDLILDDQEPDKEKSRTAKREASVFLDKRSLGTPVKHDFTKLRPFTDQHTFNQQKLAHRPIKLSLNGDNMHSWEPAEGDDLARRSSARTPKDLSKRMTRLWKHGNLFRPFPSPKGSPLDAPVSASGPYTPSVIATRFSFSHSPGESHSATWNILQFYSPHLPPNDGTGDLKTAGLPPKPHSARPKVPPLPVFMIPPPPPSAPLKRKGSTATPQPPTPMKASSIASTPRAPPTAKPTKAAPTPMKPSAPAAPLYAVPVKTPVPRPVTPMKSTSTVPATPTIPPVPKTPSKLKKKMPVVLIPPTSSPSISSGSTTSTASGKSASTAVRRPLPSIPPPTPIGSGNGNGLIRSNTTVPRAASPVLMPPRAKSEVHPTWWHKEVIPPVPVASPMKI